MRALPFDSEFDAVINIFTAFGYFTDQDDDLRVLRAIRNALAPGGRFLLESVHRDGLLSRFRSRDWGRTSTEAVVLRERHLNLVNNVMREKVELIRPDGTRSSYEFEIRMRTLQAYLDLLREADLEPEGWYGGLAGEPLEPNSFRMVVLSRRSD
jgi:SAM-dependent methyltransferase